MSVRLSDHISDGIDSVIEGHLKRMEIKLGHELPAKIHNQCFLTSDQRMALAAKLHSAYRASLIVMDEMSDQLELAIEDGTPDDEDELGRSAYTRYRAASTLSTELFDLIEVS